MNGKNQDKTDQEKAGHIVDNKNLLKYFGLPEVDFPAAQVTGQAAVFEDRLEEFLSDTWPEWGTACASTAAAAGVTLAKNQLAYRTATLEAKGTVPEMLTQILEKAKGA